MNNTVDTLTLMGSDFQLKVVASLILDKEFLESSYDVLYPEYFDSDSLQWIIKKIKNYFTEYKEIPTADVFRAELAEEKNNTFKTEIINKLNKIAEFSNSPDLKYVKEKFLEFCINQHYKLSIYKSVDLLKNGEYEKIKKLFDDAAKIGKSKNIGFDLINGNVAILFEKTARKTISTPWEIINNITGGGLGGGELGIVIGGPGGGKTWALCALGTNAITLGFNVIHYTLELSESMVAKRYYSILTKIPTLDLEYNIDEISLKLKTISTKYNNKLIIKQYPTKVAGVNTLRAHIDSMIRIGIQPHLVIVDYGDLLKSSQLYKEKRFELTDIFEDLRGFSIEYNIPVWTASQANRSAAETEIISGEQISEDYGKIMIGDFIFSISRKLEDQLYKTARVYIVKNRFGIDKIQFPAKFDVSNGNLSIFDSKSPMGKKIEEEYKNQEKLIKQELKEKFYSFKNNVKK